MVHTMRVLILFLLITPVHAQVIRVGVDVPREQVSLWRGIRFGAEEARHTARLLGRDFELITGPAAITIRGPVVSIVANGKSYRISPREKAAWHPSLKKFGAGELNERFQRETKHPMDEAAWLGWVAVKIAAEAALRGQEIGKVRIDGHKGVPLKFDAQGDLIQPLYVIRSGALVE